MTKEDKLILVGVISAAHGIKGNVIIKSFTKPVANMLKLNLFDEENNPIAPKKIRENSKEQLICSLEGCNTRNLAEEIKGTKIYSFRKNLPKITSKEEFYFEDLINLKVLNTRKEEIGVISNVANYGAGDLIEIKFKDDGREEMFHFSKELFLEVTSEYVVFCD